MTPTVSGRDHLRLAIREVARNTTARLGLHIALLGAVAGCLLIPSVADAKEIARLARLDLASYETGLDTLLVENATDQHTPGAVLQAYTCLQQAGVDGVIGVAGITRVEDVSPWSAQSSLSDVPAWSVVGDRRLLVRGSGLTLDELSSADILIGSSDPVVGADANPIGHLTIEQGGAPPESKSYAVVPTGVFGRAFSTGILIPGDVRSSVETCAVVVQRDRVDAVASELRSRFPAGEGLTVRSAAPQLVETTRPSKALASRPTQFAWLFGVLLALFAWRMYAFVLRGEFAFYRFLGMTKQQVRLTSACALLMVTGCALSMFGTVGAAAVLVSSGLSTNSATVARSVILFVGLAALWLPDGGNTDTLKDR